ncbi:hypothetical protein ES703_92860 [subsurface metagenome]
MSVGPVQDERQVMPLVVTDAGVGKRVFSVCIETGLAIINNKPDHVAAT